MKKITKKRGTVTKPAVVVAKFKPPIARIANNLEKIALMKKQKEALDLRVKGESFEVIGEKLGIDPKDAFQLVQQSIDRWAGELQLSAKQHREMDLKRYDALLVILWKDIEPYVMKDARGRPIINEATGMPEMKNTNLAAVKLYIEILQNRAKLLGTESAVKMVVDEDNNVVRREYVGVDIDAL